MMRILNRIMLLCILGFASVVFADDIDIYLQRHERGANTPYLMLMIDYSPEAFISFCQPLSNCVSKMTENAFAKMCRLYATPLGVDKQYTESACHLFYRQIKEGGLTTQSTSEL